MLASKPGHMSWMAASATMTAVERYAVPIVEPKVSKSGTEEVRYQF
jgi:hypothetical protein